MEKKYWKDGVLVRHIIDGIPQSVGKGDKIERIAKPIANIIDKVAGTKIVGCGGCKKMKERLNTGMSITEAIKRRLTNR